MKILFLMILILMLMFSLGVSAYVSLFKIPFKNTFAKAAAFLTLGAATTAFTFVICLTILWPPVM